ncbi:MAG: CoA ester lyase [Chitinophagaceae bacterium]|nr:CoA ester lyase [Chitinophagaceae bacterium]
MSNNVSKNTIEAPIALGIDKSETTSSIAKDGIAAYEKQVNKSNKRSDTKLKVRYWRSLLFIPQYAYHKALTIGADCFIADLQDSIPLHLKEEARQGIIDADLKGIFQNCNLIVRINELEERAELLRDLEKMVGLPSVLGFLVTMIESANDMDELHALVSAEEQKKGIPIGTYRFIVLVETPAAIFNALEIAKAGGGRNIGMLFGSGDLFRLTRADSAVKLTLDFPRNDIVFACRAAGIEPFDTPYTNIEDKIGLEWSCVSGKKHGFTGKAAIHSSHIKTIKRVFTPEPKKIEQAKAILAAQKNGQLTILQQKTKWAGGLIEPRVTDGMGKLGGKLIGPPHIKDSLFLLEQAKALMPKAKPGLRGKAIKHIANNKLQAGEVIPNPFEMTITESLLGLWQTAFYSQDIVVTSQLYAQKLGLAPKGQSSVPFMMGMYLAVCMSETHGALYHLGFRNARQHAPIYSGLTVRQNIIIKSIQLTSNQKIVSLLPVGN